MSQPIVHMDRRLAQRLAEKKAALDALRPLSPATLRRLHAELQLLLTFHSTGIEGNTLSLRETQLVIEHGLTIGGHPLREHLEATNHAEAYQHLLTLADAQTPLSAETLHHLHRLVMDKLLEGAEVGAFRRGPVSIRGARIQPPPARAVPAQIAEWLAWINGPGQQYEPITRAAIAHHDLLVIHPYRDGNGRTARLLLNLMLLQAGFAPAMLLREWRLGYLEALSLADSGRYTPIVNLIGRAVEQGLEIYLTAAATSDPDDELQPLRELADLFDYSLDYLSLLIRKGRVPGVKRGKRWYSTAAAIERYRHEVENQAIPRGRPPHNPPNG